MLVVETTIDIGAPPMRVWRILCDFKSYPRWHPYREVEGEPVVGAKVVMVVGPKNGRARRLKATVLAATPGIDLSFTTGRPWISLATETFLLEPSARGTRLRHSADMSAFAIRLSGGDRFRTRLASVYGAVDKALKAHAATPGKVLRHRGPNGGRRA